jgi:hypothetical protein
LPSCRKRPRARSEGRSPIPHAPISPAEFAHLVVAMVEDDYLNGEIVRLDSALRMQPK